MSGFSSEMVALVLALSESENQPHQWIDRPDEVWQQIRESDYVKTLWQYAKLCKRVYVRYTELCEHGYSDEEMPVITSEILVAEDFLLDIEQELDRIMKT